MKTILFLNSCVEWGGGENWTFETANAFHKKSNQYRIIVGGVTNSELYQKAQKAGIETRIVPITHSLSVLNPFKLYNFIAYLKKERVDVLFLNLSQDLKFGAFAAKLAGIKRIIYRRGSAIPIKNKFYNRFLLRNCVTDIIANSEATKKTIFQNTSSWLAETKIRVIYNGVDLVKIDRDLSHGSDLRHEFKINDNTILIANIGRLTPQKGHKYLIQAVNIMSQKIKDFKVLVVGKGELETELREQVKMLGLEDYIIFAGFRTDIYHILDQTDFLLHTALWEGFGYVIAEAMAVRKPVVSTNVSNIDEIIIDGETGYLAESENPEDIAAKAIKMCLNPNKKELGRRGRELVEEKFSFDVMLNSVEDCYLN
jgi:glycosyltransferase involved in cell wall biosynthesis